MQEDDVLLIVQGYETKTVTELADELGVSHKRISAMIHKARQVASSYGVELPRRRASVNGTQEMYIKALKKAKYIK